MVKAEPAHAASPPSPPPKVGEEAHAAPAERPIVGRAVQFRADTNGVKIHSALVSRVHPDGETIDVHVMFHGSGGVQHREKVPHVETDNPYRGNSWRWPRG